MSLKYTSEKEFHNQWAENLRLEELLVRESFESPTAIENRYALSQMGDLRGKKILDLGCGAGESAVYFALCGAEVYGCDISNGLLEVAKQLAEKYNVHIEMITGSASSLPYKDAFFDCVFANGVLHHVRLGAALKEVSRVLKPGAKAVFVEPLAYNPVINIYRKMAEEVRSEHEKPLTLPQIYKIKNYFATFAHREFWFFSLFVFLHFFFVRGWHPSKVRYWKRVIEEGKNYEGMFSVLERLDRILLTCLPFLGWLCWNTVIVVTKPLR
jgi:ubiquinone/menaquinone biosynthesis C-methylase UbiE